jgi:hypothetical protein
VGVVVMILCGGVEAGILPDAVLSSVSVEVDGLWSRVNDLIAESRFSGVVRVDRSVRRCWSVLSVGLIGRI